MKHYFEFFFLTFMATFLLSELLIEKDDGHASLKNE